LKAYSLVETVVSVGLLALMIPPFVLFTNRYGSVVNSQRIEADYALNIAFVMNSIQEDLGLTVFIESDFQPKNSVDSNLLQFRLTNGKIVRYYKVGDELVKDFNFIGYNAITPKIIQRFQVRRFDIAGTLCIDITIQDRAGHVYHRKIIKKTPI